MLTQAMRAPAMLAHAVTGRLDLPVPRWLFLFGAITALVISFVALGVLWQTPRLQQARSGGPLPLQWLWRNRIVSLLFRSLAFALFLITVAAAFGGDAGRNITPIVLFIWLWVGLAVAHAIFGNLWKVLSPFDTLARLLGIADHKREVPARWGVWPAAIGLFAFVWLELVAPFNSIPMWLGVVVVLYTAWTLAGMAIYGRETWNRHGEAFAVYFELLSRIAPFTRDEQDRVVMRPVMGGLPQIPVKTGIVAFIMVILGSTTFDGFTRSNWWRSMEADLHGTMFALVGTLALLAAVLLVTGAYALAMWGASRVSGQPTWVLAVRFIHTIVPIAFAYILAHYFSLLLIEGQYGIIRASDPFGLDWNLFGTITWFVNDEIVSTETIWYVQVGAIVAGHVGGVVLAHDRAIAMFPRAIALRTQYALLAVMVVFTTIGLMILSG